MWLRALHLGEGSGGGGGGSASTPPPVPGTDVYVAGCESNRSHTVAKVWKNGVATARTDGTKSANATGIAIAGTGVYVAGTVSNGTHAIVKVWKNGTATSLTDGTKTASPLAVAISVHLGVRDHLPLRYMVSLRRVNDLGTPSYPHSFLDPKGLPVALFHVLANAFLAYANRDSYKPLFKA